MRSRARTSRSILLLAVAVATTMQCLSCIHSDYLNLLLIEGSLVDEVTGEPLAEHPLAAEALFDGAVNPRVSTYAGSGVMGTTDQEGGFTVSVSDIGANPARVDADELLLRITRSVDAAEEGAEPETCEVEVVVSFADPSTYEASFFDDDPGHPVWQILEPIPVPACGEE
jgi:hypothetical protein